MILLLDHDILSYLRLTSYHASDHNILSCFRLWHLIMLQIVTSYHVSDHNILSSTATIALLKTVLTDLTPTFHQPYTHLQELTPTFFRMYQLFTFTKQTFARSSLLRIVLCLFRRLGLKETWTYSESAFAIDLVDTILF